VHLRDGGLELVSIHLTIWEFNNTWGSVIDEGNGRVLKSTSEDNVFVYFIDHGAPGVVEFPNG
jgi:hypothetical protein